MTDVCESIIEEEVGVLEAIYIHELEVRRNERNEVIEMVLQLHPSTGDNVDQQYVCMTLILGIPTQYPNEPPNIQIKNPRGIGEEEVQSMVEAMLALCDEWTGEAMLYELIRLAKETLTEGNIPRCACMICLAHFVEGDNFQKTSCYHYFHDDCLGRYVKHVLLEEPEVRLAHVKVEAKKLLCPVCREEINYSEDCFPDTPVEEKIIFYPSAEMKKQQLEMAAMLERQRQNGGLIDLEAEKNKYLIKSDEFVNMNLPRDSSSISSDNVLQHVLENEDRSTGDSRFDRDRDVSGLSKNNDHRLRNGDSSKSDGKARQHFRDKGDSKRSSHGQRRHTDYEREGYRNNHERNRYKDAYDKYDRGTVRNRSLRSAEHDRKDHYNHRRNDYRNERENNKDVHTVNKTHKDHTSEKSNNEVSHPKPKCDMNDKSTRRNDDSKYNRDQLDKDCDKSKPYRRAGEDFDDSNSQHCDGKPQGLKNSTELRVTLTNNEGETLDSASYTNDEQAQVKENDCHKGIDLKDASTARKSYDRSDSRRHAEDRKGYTGRQYVDRKNNSRVHAEERKDSQRFAKDRRNDDSKQTGERRYSDRQYSGRGRGRQSYKEDNNKQHNSINSRDDREFSSDKSDKKLSSDASKTIKDSESIVFKGQDSDTTSLTSYSDCSSNHGANRARHEEGRSRRNQSAKYKPSDTKHTTEFVRGNSELVKETVDSSQEGKNKDMLGGEVRKYNKGRGTGYNNRKRDTGERPGSNQHNHYNKHRQEGVVDTFRDLSIKGEDKAKRSDLNIDSSEVSSIPMTSVKVVSEQSKPPGFCLKPPPGF